VLRAAALLLAVLAAHYGYVLVDDVVARRWTFYVLRGLEGAVLASLLIRPRPWGSARAACLGSYAAALTFIEEAQTSICGIAEWRTDVADDLCMSLVGGHTFAAVASGAIAALVVMNRGNNG
jgi:hypothetical protein